ncbi:hypothetical protein FEM03_14315 [Phragmitibacter flavus]|uniref:FecR protein domain-containing protein n=1 Tax=Phragmitibacter flavus TaxID=2576071 RepID=A0A5R8KC81_9BACT|nr:FecR domain-containing protein [Phragmitibacter flavus]TLD69906.1 hypothetical protein FEM03_14315 [Phragmitibacter flavus]
MNPIPPEDSAKINRALDHLIDGSLSAEELLEVQEWMKADAKVLNLYLEKMSMESLLKDHVWIRKEPEVFTAPIKLRRVDRRRLVMLAAAACLALLLVLTLWMKPRQDAGAGLVSGERLPSVQFSAASVFEGVSSKTSDDGALPFGDGVVMQDGSVSIRLPSGVEALLKSPSRFSITGANRLKLDQGSGWFRVPPEAKGFAVDLPEMEVIDLGTVFTVRVDELEHQVQVEQGLVEVRQRTVGLGTQRLKAGEMLVRRANHETVQLVSGASLVDPDSLKDDAEVVFRESLTGVSDQPFSERIPLKGSWTVLEGIPQISHGRFVARSNFTHLMGRFSRPIEPSENAVVMVSFKSVSPMSLFHSEGFAGISLFDRDGELMFFGDKGEDSYSWELLTFGKNYRGPAEKRRAYDLAIQGSAETFTLRYRQRTGAFEVFRGWGAQGLPLIRGTTDAGLRFDGVRIANGEGGDFSFEDIEVSVVKETKGQ